MRPDSTIPDSELHHPPPQQAQPHHHPALAAVSGGILALGKDYSDSPKRISLDERLEKELGLPRREEEMETALGKRKYNRLIPREMDTASANEIRFCSDLF